MSKKASYSIAVRRGICQIAAEAPDICMLQPPRPPATSSPPPMPGAGANDQGTLRVERSTTTGKS